MIVDGRDFILWVLILYLKLYIYFGNINFMLDGLLILSFWRLGFWSGGNGVNFGVFVKKVILVDFLING